MSLEFLQVTWFLLVSVLVLGFTLLSGFDLGVGNLHLFTKDYKEREANFYTIGPFWDANQVWLITGGGALFAAFPIVYATAFSSFYLALMLVLFALIFRGVSIEFQHQLPSPEWRKYWDIGFGVGSILASVLFGVAIGNIMRGIPLDSSQNFAGTFFGLLNPYALSIGVVSLFMLSLHGASFLIARGQGATVDKARKWGQIAWFAFVVFYLVATILSYLQVPRLFQNFSDYPVLFVLPLVVLAGCAYYPRALKSRSLWAPFTASSLIIIGTLGTLAGSLFPYLIPASNDLANSLTIFNSSSSQLTLTVMFALAIVGMPIVIIYSTFVYRKFKKPTKTTPVSKSSHSLNN